MKGMMDSMFYLAEDHPNLVTITDIGDSWLKNNEGRHDGTHDIPDGGYDIYVLNITASDSARQSGEKGKMLITSGVHAREWAPPELLARFIEMLVHGYNDDADITSILQQTEVHAILYVNPDGRFMAEKYPELYWRKNLHPIRCGGGYEYGVDINRNFNFQWANQEGASSNPCDEDYHGPTAESEPETQALADYAKQLFPESQRRENTEDKLDVDVPFGEDITGMYIDIHSSGGYVYYPWGHKDEVSPDDEALQALGRKINSFNGYKLWAGGQPDFVYPASGDTSDWAYAVLGVASLGFEIGDDFQQECDSFEDEVVPMNLPALLYAAKTVQKPFSTIKGPDILDLDISEVNGEITVSARASDSEMVNAIYKFLDFETGNQAITNVQLYLDVHPDDYQEDGTSWEMQYMEYSSDSSEETVGLVLEANILSPGKHTLFIQATDSDGYKGPVTSAFVEVSDTEPPSRGLSLRGARVP
jgi:carboxypeptidase T